VKGSLAAKLHFGRSFRMILPGISILFVGILIILSVMVYKIAHPGAVPESVNPSYYLLPSIDVAFSSMEGDQIPGWWIPGLKGAPSIILAPGYGMSRSDALSLAALLHENAFNILIFDQRGCGADPRGASTLGLKEVDDMKQAVRFIQTRPDCNANRIGIWGVDISALAALQTAAAFDAVRAIVADSAFESISDFMDYRIDEDFGLENKILKFGCFQIFRLENLFSNSSFKNKLQLEEIAGRSILFIKGDNRKRLGKFTTAIYDRIQPQKEMISFRTARVLLMSGEDLRSYDRQTVNFFTLNLR
jgi:uncharacterized protein